MQESNFHDYQMVRADNFPETVHVHIVEQPFSVHATGVSESGVPPFVAALVNAIANASGKRIRNLPIGDQLDGLICLRCAGGPQLSERLGLRGRDRGVTQSQRLSIPMQDADSGRPAGSLPRRRARLLSRPERRGVLFRRGRLSRHQRKVAGELRAAQRRAILRASWCAQGSIVATERAAAGTLGAARKRLGRGAEARANSLHLLSLRMALRHAEGCGAAASRS